MPLSTHDFLVKRLRDLCDRQGGHKAVADAADVSAANLWQILNGTKLASGRARGVGPNLQQKLTRRFPDWLDLQHSVEGDNRPRGAVAHIVSQSVA